MDRNLKILVISNLFPPEFLGGYEIGCFRIVEELAKRGHEITVLTTGTYNDSNYSYRIVRELEFADIYRSNIAKVSQLAKLLIPKNITIIDDEIFKSRKEYDCVYVFNILGLGGLGIIDYLNNTKIPWVWHLMDNLPHILTHNLPNSILNIFECSLNLNFSANTHIFVSHTLRCELAKQNIEFTGDVKIVPCWSVFDKQTANIIPKKIEGLNKIVVLGTVSEEKGAELILQSIKELRNEGISGFSVDFYGGGNFQLYRDLFIDAGLGDIVKFHGPIPQEKLLNILPSFDTLLFPTWDREPFGFVALEAAAAGLLPIITMGAGVTEFLKEGIHYVSVNRTVKSIKNAIIFSNDVRNREMISSQSTKFVAENFSLETIATSIEKILYSVAERNKYFFPARNKELELATDAKYMLIEKIFQHKDDISYQNYSDVNKVTFLAKINYRNWKRMLRKKYIYQNIFCHI